MHITKYFIAMLLPAMLLLGCEQGTDKKQTEGQLPKPSVSGDASPFVWNFEEPRTIIYNYAQNVTNEFIIGKDDNSKEMTTNAVGHLKVMVNESKLADLNLKLSMNMVSPDGDTTPERDSPPLFVQDMAADGSMEDKNSETLFKSLFPLPPHSLNLGETASLPMTIPFNVAGSVLKTKGSLELTYLEDTVLLGRNCAILSGVLDVSDTKIPEGMELTLEGGTTGSGRYYFDTTDGVFVKVVLDMTMEYKFETEGAGELFGGSNYTKSVNHFEIVLKEVED